VPTGSNAPEPLLGVMCIVFGIGVSGSEWVARLAHSKWFVGLETRPEDLTAADAGAMGR